MAIFGHDSKKKQKKEEEGAQLLQLSKDAWDSGDQAGGLEYWKKAAKLHNPEAQYLCALHYRNGTLTGGPDLPHALYFYAEDAAAAGYAKAQFLCGVMYENGEGTKPNLKKALSWYEAAAKQGHSSAQFNCGGHVLLGTRLREGLGKVALLV